jgi:BirA family biotin operon repressor/biotin-[acetyl-CoA-carboxylase] ligase
MGTAKMGGILVESTTARGSPGFVATIGFGLNLASAPGDLGRAATALCEHTTAPTPDRLLTELSAEISRWLAIWQDGRNFAAIRKAWMDRSGPVGEAISVNTVDGPVSGTYQGLSETGALLADVGGSVREITHGEVLLAGAAGHDGGK